MSALTLERPFDVTAVRADFPILSRTVHGKPLIYLDNAATAQKPEAVISAMADFQRTSNANAHRGLHTLANEATQAMEDARAAVAHFLSASRPEEIVFTKGATEAINLVANGLAARLKPGDEIVLSEMEHHANIVPWYFLRERCGAVIRWVPVLDDGALDMAAYRALLGPRTRIVALTHMSNVLGTLNDAAEIVSLAHAAGALVLLDGCQAVVHGAVDVSALDVDFYVQSAHKLYGPTGIGVLYGKAGLLADLPPYNGGGGMIDLVTTETVTYGEAPFRFEAGTPPITEAVGFKAALDWLGAQDAVAAHAHVDGLYARAFEALRGVNGVRVHGTAPGKGAILSFSVEGAHPHDVAQILDRYGVAVRAGHHCAQPLMRRLGVTATARASFALYNTADEVDAFADALAKARDFLS
jgi:cysteine desulfurase / selenocysteine lyase